MTVDDLLVRAEGLDSLAENGKTWYSEAVALLEAAEKLSDPDLYKVAEKIFRSKAPERTKDREMFPDDWDEERVKEAEENGVDFFFLLSSEEIWKRLAPRIEKQME